MAIHISYARPVKKIEITKKPLYNFHGITPDKEWRYKKTENGK